MILSYQSILAREGMIVPMEPRTRLNGVTHGLGPAGYDVRVAEDLHLNVDDFVLASTIERFDMPLDVIGRVCDKSTWIRRGLHVHNTVIEPGWRGFLTLELKYHGPPRSSNGIAAPRFTLHIAGGTAIAQILFERLDEPTQYPYSGKYQDQSAGAQPAIMEGYPPVQEC